MWKSATRRKTPTGGGWKALAVALAAIGITLTLSVGIAFAAPDPAADRLYREAERQSRTDPAAALAGFELLVEQFPRDELAPRAQLRVAEIRRDLRDALKTDIAIDRLIDDYGRSPEAASAFLLRGRLQYDAAGNVADLEAALATLRRVPLLFDAATFPGLAPRAEARLLEGRISRTLGDLEGASAALVALLEDEPQGPVTTAARVELAKVLLEGAYWQAAVELLQRSIDLAGGSDAGAQNADIQEASGPMDPVALPPRADRAERNLLALIHRRYLRPQSGERLFPTARPLRLEGLNGPGAIAAAADGRLLVLDDGGDTVVVLSPEGQVLGRTAIKKATSPWWDDGRATVSVGGRLMQPFGGGAAGSGAQLAEVGKGDGFLKGMLGAARGSLGDLFVAARGESGLLRYATPNRAAVLLDEGKRQVVDVTASRGAVFALDAGDGAVWRVGVDRVPDPNPFVRGDWKRPVAIAADDLGTLFVLDRNLRRIDVFDADRNRITSLGPTLPGGIELRAPTDIAVDAAGRLFIADPKLAQLVVLE